MMQIQVSATEALDAGDVVMIISTIQFQMVHQQPQLY